MEPLTLMREALIRYPNTVSYVVFWALVVVVLALVVQVPTPEARRRRKVRRYLATIGYLILATAMVFAFWRDQEIRRESVKHLNHVNASQCASLTNLYNVIRKTLEDSDKAIDTIAYYQEHPRERAAAHERNRSTLMLFRQPPCPDEIRLDSRP